MNAVYQTLKNMVRNVEEELRNEYKAWKDAQPVQDPNAPPVQPHTQVHDGPHMTLHARNRGVRCFMNKPVEEDSADLQKLINEFAKPNVQTKLELSELRAVDAVFEDDDLQYNTMTVMYSRTSAPLDLVYGGIPSDLVSLVIQSTLLRQLKSNSMYLSDSNDPCKLFVHTSFYIPNVQVRRAPLRENFAELEESERFDLNLCMMSSVDSVMTYQEEEKGNVNPNAHNLIRQKLLVPFMMALVQNRNRVNLGLPPMRNLVLGDMGLRVATLGQTSLFVKHLRALMEQFEGCFDRVVVCGHHDLLDHLHLAGLSTGNDE
jgi:hypothetical protein